ncbi:MAG: hypothetical protein PHT94_01740, partial [Candidatus Nanoarchaeia archaeon]|nr:hypothetical protein [Candidatus Nanoarchaeia archaeon]
EKEYEATIGYSKIRDIFKNDVVSIQNKKFRVDEVLIFKDFKEAFENIDFKLIMPDVSSKEKAIKEMKQIYSTFKQEKYGVYIFKFKYEEELQTKDEKKQKSKKKILKRKNNLKKFAMIKLNEMKSNNQNKSNFKNVNKIDNSKNFNDFNNIDSNNIGIKKITKSKNNSIKKSIQSKKTINSKK